MDKKTLLLRGLSTLLHIVEILASVGLAWLMVTQLNLEIPWEAVAGILVAILKFVRTGEDKDFVNSVLRK